MAGAPTSATLEGRRYRFSRQAREPRRTPFLRCIHEPSFRPSSSRVRGFLLARRRGVRRHRHGCLGHHDLLRCNRRRRRTIGAEHLARDEAVPIPDDCAGPHLRAAIMQAVRKDPTERFGTMEVFRRALESAAHADGIPLMREAVTAFVRAHLGAAHAKHAAFMQAALQAARTSDDIRIATANRTANPTATAPTITFDRPNAAPTPAPAPPPTPAPLAAAVHAPPKKRSPWPRLLPVLISALLLAVAIPVFRKRSQISPPPPQSAPLKDRNDALQWVRSIPSCEKLLPLLEACPKTLSYGAGARDAILDMAVTFRQSNGVEPSRAAVQQVCTDYIAATHATCGVD